MIFWIVNCSIAFLICVFCAGIIIPQILLIAFRKRLFDLPDERKIHHCAVPRLGGIAFKPVVFFTVALLLGINMVMGHSEMLSEIENDVRPLAFAFCSIMVLYLVGMADDLIGIRYRAKFVIQILCGMMLIAGGIYIDNLYGILGIHSVPLWLGYPLTILFVVFIINAINLIDGIDGLASGLCSIACLLYGLTFLMFHQYIYAMLAFATLGVLVPFFYYNVFGNAEHGKKIFMGDTGSLTGSIACLLYGLTFLMFHQYIYAMLAFATLGVLVPFFYYNVFGNAEHGKKIFMGDTGSLTVGMMLCLLSLKLTMCGTDDNTVHINPMVLAFSPLLIPCCDVVRVYLHRVRNGKNPFLPDKNHIHHKLLAVGMQQRSVMIIVISVSTVFILFNILLSLYLNVNWIVLVDILIWTFTNIRLTKRIGQLQSRQATNK